jgi:predicted molibdopterin-dependent oxidoreductase YjgC
MMNVTIDNRQLTVKEGMTVLDAAAEQGIYIPHLCSHRELTPYGGCRLCIIEIEGRRGYPTACTATVEEGMIVRTQTQALQEMRRGLIQLMLSEHPSGCLVCGDVDGCAQYQGTIRKVGVTTGCRWCSRDEECELQKVAKHLEIKELTLPVLYRGMELERYDPFFDRDYNLCIYCGRCVRICQEFRKSSVLALKGRGKLSTIGTAFDENHVQADCEFCGACISVCPTGAMSERSRKWWGAPDSLQVTYCPLCSLNCELQSLSKNCTIVGTLPPGEPHYSGGELCVKGRFCLSELVNRAQRVLEPEYRYPEGVAIESWAEVMEKIPAHLGKIEKDRTALFLSPYLTVEEMAAAKLFAGEVLNTSIITSSVLSEDLVKLLTLPGKRCAPSDIEGASGIFTFWLNGNYGYAPATLAIKRAAEKGASYIQVGWLRDTTSRFAAHRILPTPGEEAAFLDEVLAFIEKGSTSSSEAQVLGEMLQKSSPSVIIAGPSILSLTAAPEILARLGKIAALSDSMILALAPQGNIMGLLSLEGIRYFGEVEKLVKEGKIDVLYAIGDVPFEERPSVSLYIHQSPFVAPEKLQADMVLPSTLWGEEGGTLRGTDGRERNFKNSALPPGIALSHGEIFAQMAKALGRRDSIFTVEEASKTISRETMIKASSMAERPAVKDEQKASDGFPMHLIVERNPHRYSGLSLSATVSGFGEIVPEDMLMLNPIDARRLAVKDADAVTVKSMDHKASYAIMIRKIIPAGYAYLVTSRHTLDFARNPCPVDIRREHV